MDTKSITTGVAHWWYCWSYERYNGTRLIIREVAESRTQQDLYTGYGMFHCDSMKYESYIVHWITMKTCRIPYKTPYGIRNLCITSYGTSKIHNSNVSRTIMVLNWVESLIKNERLHSIWQFCILNCEYLETWSYLLF